MTQLKELHVLKVQRVPNSGRLEDWRAGRRQQDRWRRCGFVEVTRGQRVNYTPMTRLCKEAVHNSGCS